MFKTIFLLIYKDQIKKKDESENELLASGIAYNRSRNTAIGCTCATVMWYTTLDRTLKI